jgi:hypothetical protein
MPWAPGDPWPSTTPGGARRDAWGGYLKLWVLAEIAPGRVWKLGPDPNDRLDAGNVLGDVGTLAGGGGTPADTLPVTTGLWVDLTCDLVELELTGGAPTATGVLSRTDAGTLTARLWDPTGKYDPLNPDTPFSLGGRSRLVAGARVICFAEVINDPTAVTPAAFTYYLFTGTVDSWVEDWTKEPGERFATLTATDLVKRLNKMDRGEQPPTGDGDTVFTRLGRIATYYGFNPPSGLGTLTTRTLTATTFAQSAWELIQRAVDDDLGFLYVTGSGILVYQSSLMWQTHNAPSVKIGCDDPGAFDIVTDARPGVWDAGLYNYVTASNSGGTAQTASNTASITTKGQYEYKRTDLGLADDTQAAGWAVNLVSLAAFPRHAVDRILLAPRVAPDSWRAFARVFGLTPVSSIVELKFRTDRFDYEIDETVRLVGWTHTVTAYDWQTEWRTVAASAAAGANPWTLGPAAFDRLDAGNVLN